MKTFWTRCKIELICILSGLGLVIAAVIFILGLRNILKWDINTYEDCVEYSKYTINDLDSYCQTRTKQK